MSIQSTINKIREKAARRSPRRNRPNPRASHRQQSSPLRFRMTKRGLVAATPDDLLPLLRARAARRQVQEEARRKRAEATTRR
mgnify:CR=1 FL=1